MEDALRPQTATISRSTARTGVLYRSLIALTALSLLAVVFIFPLLWMLSTSFKVPGDELVWPPQWLPAPATFDNYANLFSSSTARYIPFLTFTFNGLYIAVVV